MWPEPERRRRGSTALSRSEHAAGSSGRRSVSRLPCPAAIRLVWVALCLTSVSLFAGCGGAPEPGRGPARLTSPDGASAFPLTLTDDSGRQVVVPREPQRIVSAAPSTTEILFALGAGDRVVGVTTYCDYPAAAKAKPKIGGLRPSVEVIVASQPDLVLAVRSTPPDVLAALEKQQIPVIVLNPPDFAGVLANVRAVGRVTGAAAPAERLVADLQGRWRAVEERARQAPARPRVLYEIDATDPAAVSAAGAGTFIDAMITAAGGVNVVAALAPGRQYPTLSAEAVLQANPELILLGDAAYGQSRATVARRPGWDVTVAVQRGAVVGIADPDLTSRAGPRLVDGLELVARAIHPELFGPPLPVATPRAS